MSPREAITRLAILMAREMLMGLGTKWDNGKARLSKLPWRELETVSRVLMFGAAPKDKGGRGYAWDNWMHVALEPFDGDPDGRMRYVDAGLRHMAKRATGEVIDPDSGEWRIPHLASAICCCLFAMWADTELGADKASEKGK